MYVCALQPCQLRDWELHVHFRIHGSAAELYGDGLAVWYTKHRMELGNVSPSTLPLLSCITISNLFPFHFVVNFPSALEHKEQNNNNNNKVTYKQCSLTQTCCRHMSFSAVEQVCLQVSCKSCRQQCERCRSVGRLFQMSGPETAKFLRPMVVAVHCTLSLLEAADLRCRRPASSTTCW